MKILYTDKKPVIKDLNRVFDSVGWGKRDEKIMEEALENTLYSISAYDVDRLVGYGRIIGDKTIFFTYSRCCSRFRISR